MADYIYLNVSPEGKHRNDCVTRALTLASGLSYPIIRKKLFHTSRLFGCDKLCVCCYEHLLEDVFKYEPIDCEGYSVGEFADTHPYGTYLVRMENHISTIIDGNVYDIFDCRDMILSHAWKVD